ncbi:hypothetical protein [Microbacterium excoecariae]|uniref:hypothetical protein n=1 Tax=Microbacterium excoecariae TaxID=2715210 RepID=UPI001407C840|nr:hypothetical protein [Microbacterium excoecariae]NHI16885.1 hypothetical protein [Microbacterium excoecariae]
MGGNRRYPEHGEKLREERELRDAAKAGPLQSLTPEQLALHAHPLTVAPERHQPITRAWLRFGTTDVRVTVRACRWTDHAVGIETRIHNHVLRAWVWRGAVDPW